MALLAGILFNSVAIVYYLLIRSGRKLVGFLSGIHYFFSLLPGIFVLVFKLFEKEINTSLSTEDMSEYMQTREMLAGILALTVLVALIGQVIFMVNIAIALVAKRTNP